jgi:hypothetical protein
VFTVNSILSDLNQLHTLKFYFKVHHNLAPCTLKVTSSVYGNVFRQQFCMYSQLSRACRIVRLHIVISNRFGEE